MVGPTVNYYCIEVGLNRLLKRWGIINPFSPDSFRWFKLECVVFIGRSAMTEWFQPKGPSFNNLCERDKECVCVCVCILLV